MSSFQKTILTSLILLVLVVLILSQATFAKRIGLPAGLFEMVRDWLASGAQLSACDYKDGEILLIKPIATGVGEGRYEAGDIVEIRDGETLCQRFGNGNFLGNEERTQLLPVYYPKKLTEEQKKELLEPEYDNNSPPASPDASRGGQPSLNTREGVPPLTLRGGEGELQKDQKLLHRRQVGLDYAQFLSDRDILKVRNFQQLDRLPEIDLSNIIDKKSGISFSDPNNPNSHPNDPNRCVIARSPAKRDDEAIPPASLPLQRGEWNTAIASNGGSSSGLLRFARNDMVSVVRLPKFSSSPQMRGGIKGGELNSETPPPPTPSSTEEGRQSKSSPPLGGVRGDLVSAVQLPKRIQLYESALNTIKKIAQAIIKPVFAQGAPTEVVKTVDTGGYADYLSLNAWEGAQEANLPALNQIRIAKCRHATATSTADTEAVTITGWTTDATRYIKIWTDPNESYRHNGKWDTGKYRLEVTTGSITLDINEDYVRVEGLQLYSDYSASSMIILTRYQTSVVASNIHLSHNILKAAGNTNTGFGVLNAASAGATVRAWNNILYDIKGGDGQSAYAMRCSDTDGVCYFYNNTMVNNDAGINSAGATVVTAINNIVKGSGNTNAYIGTFNANTDYNATDGTDTGDGGANSRISQTFLFADEANSDFHLASGDTGAKDYGINLTSDVYLPLTSDVDNQARPSAGSGQAWDIGADEYQAIQIYRSVGPSNTTALATGGSNALTINGSTATFASGLPANVGVGDVIQYNATSSTGAVNSLAFISGRNSATSYIVKDVGGHIASSTTSNTGWSLYRAYTSLSLAEAGTENTGINAGLRNFDTWTLGKNLASSTEQWNIAAYGDAADTTGVTISGWTTTADNYIRIFTPVSSTEVGASQRHSGKWDDGKYNRTATLNIDVTEKFVKVDGLQFKHTASSGSYDYTMDIDPATGAVIEVSNSIFKGVFSGTATYYYGILARYNASGSKTINLWNNIFYNYINGANPMKGIVISSSWTGYVYNNTIYNCETGIARSETGTLIVKNNLMASCNAAAFGTFAAGTDYNATNNASMGYTVTGGGNTHDRVSQTFAFVDAANNDFHLKSSDTGAIDNGVNLSNDSNLAFSDDIDNELRRGKWAIGADQQNQRATKINMPQHDRYTDGLVGMWSFDGPTIYGTQVYDQSGQGNTGTMTGGPTKVAGINGQALSFDGVNDYVALPSNTAPDVSFIQNTMVFTISAWIKINNLDARQTIAATVGWTTGQKGFMFAWENYDSSYGLHALRIGIMKGTSGNPAIDGHSDNNATISDNSWHPVVVKGTGAGNNITFYVDGVTKTTAYAGGYSALSSGASTNAMLIGDAPTPPILPFNGLIDEVRVYNRALSASEIKGLYNLGSAKINSSQNQKLTDGLVGLWSFDGPDMYGATAIDRSGQNNNGTLTGANGLPQKTIGKLGQALSFDGVDDYVNAGSATILDNLSAISISTWIYPHSNGDNSWGAIVQKGSGVTPLQDGWRFGFEGIFEENNRIEFRVDYFTTQLKVMSEDNAFAMNQWQHVAVVWDGSSSASNAKIYRNGVEVAYQTQTNAAGSRETDAAISLFIGYGEDSCAFDGLIDEVRIYNRALSADEIKRLYNIGR